MGGKGKKRKSVAGTAQAVGTKPLVVAHLRCRRGSGWLLTWYPSPDLQSVVCRDCPSYERGCSGSAL